MIKDTKCCIIVNIKYVKSVFRLNNREETAMNKKPSYLWLIPLSFSIPALQIVLGILRFAWIPLRHLATSLVFVPTGLLAGFVLITLMRQAGNEKHRKSTLLGFLFALPVAIYMTLIAGLIVHPLIGTALLGPIPLIIGATIGYMVGRKHKEIIE